MIFFPGFTISSDISFEEIPLKTNSTKLTAYPINFNEKIVWYPFEDFGPKQNKELMENRLI